MEHENSIGIFIESVFFQSEREKYYLILIIVSISILTLIS